MNIPFVKVNNQQEFERVVDKMQRETGLERPINCSYDYVYSIIGLNSENTRITCWMKGSKTHISADEYLTGIRTNFTLSDLEDGMVVELRDNSNKFMVLNNNLYGENTYFENLTIKENFNCNLSNIKHEELDIVKVYKLNSNILHFTDYNLTLIFDAEPHRYKLEIEQKKTDIQSKIDKLNKQLEELK